MDRTPLYQQIAETIRREILEGNLAPGDRLAPVRELADNWRCTPGTVQRAYKQLARQGLVESRTGQGTHVKQVVPDEGVLPLRRATLVNKAETFLLEVISAGFTPAEVEQAMGLALDRWRTLEIKPSHREGEKLRFVGSHDPALSLIAARFPEVASGATLSVNFAGSLGGLIALAEGQADMAGSHLWDQDQDVYNVPFVRRLLPGRQIVLLTLAHRRLGLIVAPGNPAGLKGLSDLARPGLRFVNRQPGAGTRVWLDAQLHHNGISRKEIADYRHEVYTHSEVANTIAEGQADVGLGIEAAALDYGLDFIGLTTERYDLVITTRAWESKAIQSLARWLVTEEARTAIADLGGYDTTSTGKVARVS